MTGRIVWHDICNEIFLELENTFRDPFVIEETVWSFIQATPAEDSLKFCRFWCVSSRVCFERKMMK